MKVTYGERYPLAEIEALMGWPTAEYVAEFFGVSKAVIIAWRQRGLSHRQADEVACRYGRHPVEVWPDWIDAVRLPEPSRPVREARPRGVFHHSQHETGVA